MTASQELYLDPKPAARLETFFGTLAGNARKKLSASFVEKHHRWFRPAAKPVFSKRMTRRLNRLAAILSVRSFGGVRVFDAGAGFGMNTLQLALAGASEVVAVDLRPERIQDLTQLVEIAGLDTVVPVCADYAAAMRAHGPFDLVLCNYFLSHLNSVETFLDLCHDQLRPGARIYATDDNNGLSPLRQLTVRGERWTSEFLHNRDHTKGFLHRRRGVADAALPPLPPISRWLVRERCAWATRGMMIPEVQAYCRWVLDRRHPRPPSPPFPYRDPENGIPEERLLNPFRISAGLRARQFDVTLFPADAPMDGGRLWGKAAWIRRALAPEFELTATRRS